MTTVLPLRARLAAIARRVTGQEIPCVSQGWWLITHVAVSGLCAFRRPPTGRRRHHMLRSPQVTISIEHPLPDPMI